MKNEDSIEIVNIQKITIILETIASDKLVETLLRTFTLSSDEEDRVNRLIQQSPKHSGGKEIKFMIVKPEDCGRKNGLYSFNVRDWVYEIGGEMSYVPDIARLAIFLKEYGMELPEPIRNNFRGVPTLGEEIGGPFISGLGKPFTSLSIAYGKNGFYVSTDLHYPLTSGNYTIRPDEYFIIKIKEH